MKLIVASDSHFYKTALLNLAEEIKCRGDIDAIVHLGDMQSDAAWLRERTQIPLYSVPGNCDMDLYNPAEQVIRLGGVDILLLHGHTRQVKATLDSLAWRARELNVRLALFGHTHAKHLSYAYDALLLNPGALKDDRYAVVQIDGGDIRSQFMTL